MNIRKIIAAVVAAAMATVCAWADTWFDYHTGTWTYRINGDEVEIIE